MFDFEKIPYTIQEAIKNAVIFEMKDVSLQEKALVRTQKN